jgi:hypothetical protein
MNDDAVAADQRATPCAATAYNNMMNPFNTLYTPRKQQDSVHHGTWRNNRPLLNVQETGNFLDTDEGCPEELQVKTTQCDYCAISIL